jgi:hypothetical protein
MPVAYYSKKLSKAEKNYTTTEKEGLAVVRALKEWWFYLDGNKVTVETDHSALTSLLKSSEPTGRIARWILKLRDLDFNIRHRPGKMMELPDMLSRQPRIAEGMALEVSEDLAKAQRRDAVVGALIDAVKDKKEPDNEDAKQAYQQVGDKLFLADGTLVFYDGSKKNRALGIDFRTVVPSAMRKEVIKECHDAMTSGHLGTDKTFKRVHERFWWPNLYGDVKSYVETCEACARAKKPKRTDSGWEATTVGAPWQRVSVDHLGPVKTTERGNRYLLVFTDYFTRWVVAVPTEDCGAESTAKHFVERVVLQFGAPEELLSDQGAAFVSEVVEKTCAMAGTKKIFTTSYRPQANGLVERWNGTVAPMLTTYMDENENDWDDKVPYVVFAYNTAKHAATKMTPFELVQGRKVRLPLEVALGMRRAEQRSSLEYANELLVQMQEGYRAAREASDDAKRTQERRQLQKGGGSVPGIKYAANDKIWLENPAQAGQKLEKKYDGPYNIIKMHGRNYVTIAKEDGSPQKVHVERIKPYKARMDDDDKQEAADVGVEPAEEVEVEEPNKDKLLPNDLIGKRVRVWWSGARKWYDGTVTARKKRLHVVNYDDGDVKAERLLGYAEKQAPKWKLLVKRRGSGALSF